MPSKKRRTSQKPLSRTSNRPTPPRRDRSSCPSRASGGLRKTYRQDWPAYNAAQTYEKAQFQVLLSKLTESLTYPTQRVNGRPRIPFKVAMFCAAYKVYSTFSARRFMTDLREAHKSGLITVLPHFNTVLNLLEDATITPILKTLVVTSSLPLRGIETCFAIDSSGFTAPLYMDDDAGNASADRKQHGWVKAHVMCGVKTHIITAVDIRGPHAADTNSFPCLLKKTAETFCVKEVSADKAYFSRANFVLAEKIKARPYIPFKNNATGMGPPQLEKMYYHFQLRREDFMRHYHKRSNIETVFSTLKRKYGAILRSRSEHAMVNEVLLRVVCHNVCVLIQEAQGLGIKPELE